MESITDKMTPRQKARYLAWAKAKEAKIAKTMKFIEQGKPITGIVAQKHQLHISTIYNNGYLLDSLTDTFNKAKAE
jgi:hypothetical protein